MDKVKENKQTEFNMSLETLRRINNIIVQIHQASQGLFCQNQTLNKQYYLSGIDRLFIEAQTKMTPSEILKCEQFQKEIIRLRNEGGINLEIPETDQGLGSRKPNPLYYEGWNKLRGCLREYEIFLMRTLDKHGMLLRDSMKIEDMFDEGM